jgi:hypothetical protein
MVSPKRVMAVPKRERAWLSQSRMKVRIRVYRREIIPQEGERGERRRAATGSCNSLMKVQCRCNALKKVQYRRNALKKVQCRCNALKKVQYRCNALKKVQYRCNALKKVHCTWVGLVKRFRSYPPFG